MGSAPFGGAVPEVRWDTLGGEDGAPNPVGGRGGDGPGRGTQSPAEPAGRLQDSRQGDSTSSRSESVCRTSGLWRRRLGDSRGLVRAGDPEG